MNKSIGYTDVRFTKMLYNNRKNIKRTKEHCYVSFMLHFRSCNTMIWPYILFPNLKRNKDIMFLKLLFTLDKLYGHFLKSKRVIEQDSE